LPKTKLFSPILDLGMAPMTVSDPPPAGARGGRALARWAPRLLLLLASSVVALLSAEALARWIHRPVTGLQGEFLSDQTYPGQRNAWGFREGDPTAKILGPGTTRVLFLGDSFTFGSGVANPTLRFTDRLEAELGEGVHLYNAGLPGSLPSDWVSAARALLPEYRPQVVVAVFFLRDGTNLGTSLHFHAEKIAAIKARHCDHAAYRLSHLVRFFCDRRVLRDFSEWYLGQFRTAYLGSEQDRRVWVAMQQALIQLRDMSTQAGASFHLVVFPLLFDLDDYGFHDVESEIIDFADRNGIPAITLTPGFEGRDERDLWVSDIDQHPNAEGHEIAADTLLPHLRGILK
jgi:lysophospholipase L1-like esterase